MRCRTCLRPECPGGQQGTIRDACAPSYGKSKLEMKLPASQTQRGRETWDGKSESNTGSEIVDDTRCDGVCALQYCAVPFREFCTVLFCPKKHLLKWPTIPDVAESCTRNIAERAPSCHMRVAPKNAFPHALTLARVRPPTGPAVSAPPTAPARPTIALSPAHGRVQRPPSAAHARQAGTCSHQSSVITCPDIILEDIFRHALRAFRWPAVICVQLTVRLGQSGWLSRGIRAEQLVLNIKKGHNVN
jgi:hypothetical protein